MKKFKKQFIEAEIQPDKIELPVAESSKLIVGKHVGIRWDEETKQLIPDIIPSHVAKGFGRTWEDMQKNKK